ncbi:MAG: methyltransferase domain-containing protein [Candidatus Eremiobacteraeota bacterium]|nr:methyltransferase domain-containing protein [Candidatus Eremiobacteraeota bacterium]MCW5866788.1 methyltransferase domain-containing protein [Candidatus Eremiobacteraeota bacterium]
MSNLYRRQDRGDLAAYTRYLANMDAAMRQKVALTAAHLPCQGKIADMGMGSGSGSHALAALYPRLQVVGVDVNPTMVEVAARQYQLPNLSFQVGDIAEACFEPGSLDGIVNSSVLHHVTSYNGYEAERAARALQAQVDQLAQGGCLIVRDFLAPEPGQVELRLPFSLAPRWLIFSRQFRALLPEQQRGFAYEDLGRDERGWWRLRVERRLAVEFLLRKDYTEDWAQEIQEEYTYFTQTEFEELFSRLGLRVLVSTPLYNPWIIENRFEGQFEWFELDGRPLDFPPTNYLIVGEKVGPGQGVTFRSQPAPETPRFLRMSSYQNRHTQKVYDLVCRPHPTVDVLPFYLSDSGNLTVLVRHSYPRPILTELPASLDGLLPSPYVVEPITAVQGEDPLGETVERVLEARAGIAPSAIQRLWSGNVHYPSPGGIREEVVACYVEVDSKVRPHSSIRALDAHQLLRSAQVHGLSDHRLEMHIFGLMRQLGIDPGPWLGDALVASQSEWIPMSSRWEVGRARVFLPHSRSAGFLEVRSRRFQQFSSTGQLVDESQLEYIVPSQLQSLTMAVLPMLYQEKSWWVGLDLEDLPAAQAFSGNSRHWIAPAWRLPSEVTSLEQARSWLERPFFREYGFAASDWAPLGGPYFPTPGLTPELVYPVAVRLHMLHPGCLDFFPLEELMERWEEISNGHLRCLLLRAWLSSR